MALRERIAARPVSDFRGLRVGQVYLRQARYSGDGDEVFSVVRVTPGGGQIVARPYRASVADPPVRYHAGRYRDATFVELDEALIELLGVTHEAIVTEAVRRGLDVPPRVRCEYPALFIDIPVRFARSDEVGGETPGQRVATALAMDWGASWPKRPVTTEAVDRWIAEAHRRLARFRNEAVRRVALNRDTGADYDAVEAEFHALIDFYRWLRPHVAPGGVFHVEEG